MAENDEGKGGAGGGGTDDVAKLQAALDKEREQRKETERKLRDAEGKASKLDELENASKSEVTKAAERIAELERDLAKSNANLSKLMAALDAGLPHKMAARLQGDTEEELLADAKALAEELGVGEGKGGDGKGGAGGGQQARNGDAGGGQQARTGDAAAGGGAPTPTMDDHIRQLAGRRAS